MSRCIRTFNSKHPLIAESAYIDQSAVVIGDVVIKEDTSIWPQVSVRGDLLNISIGKCSNIQDGSVLHTTEYPKDSGDGYDLKIGEYVTVGHGVILHGCHIGNNSLIGMGAIVLDGAVVEESVLVGAGSLVPPGKKLESGYMYLGSPVKKIRLLNEKEKQDIIENAKHYVTTKNRYKAEI
ncbi:gamma carbonic anhydrase family protein [Allofrancisella guangzhouensis]|uniref:Anhydrase n=1 Tax=Allofrancisella guangzhouensis TaxID=594679 RepID=A0A0A8E2H3_9GAMM|nr:gamma carbonic anhydrase family protein [Allofrancisella guangzhouensis]AJC48410.1 anhydrase [Allofrancisella guangzhouensis]MBK2027301.1 gamma carbonic anhydrase family protein [Allofrancisella guangzhouensis]MBK2043543.1 gamma carbonic anhydrase family protein [Allofrancisella guangzhouensis]MBK2045475.1 gamma carbonic anhydrase family protein [Allofrancisella guangzhouensis]